MNILELGSFIIEHRKFCVDSYLNTNFATFCKIPLSYILLIPLIYCVVSHWDQITYYSLSKFQQLSLGLSHSSLFHSLWTGSHRVWVNLLGLKRWLILSMHTNIFKIHKLILAQNAIHCLPTSSGNVLLHYHNVDPT